MAPPLFWRSLLTWASCGTVCQLRHQLRHEGVELRRVGVGQPVLVGGAGDAGAELDVLHRLIEDRQAGNAGRRLSQFADDRVHAWPLADGRQRDADLAGIGRRILGAGADIGDDVGDAGDGAEGRRRLALQRDHRRDGDILGGFGDGEDGAGILLGQEALRHHDIEQDGADQGGDRDQQHQRLAAQHPEQRDAIEPQQPVEAGFRHAGRPARALGGDRAQQPPAHHRRQRQRNHGGDDHRDRERHGEFVEQLADHARHEQQRDEDGDEGDRQRDDGEADLPGAAYRRPPAAARRPR